MRRFLATLTLCSSLLVALGCRSSRSCLANCAPQPDPSANCSVVFTSWLTADLPPIGPDAKLIRGDAAEATRIFRQIDLPHNKSQNRFRIANQARKQLTAQIGSRDYCFIGELAGYGNSYSSIAEVESRMAREASTRGSDLIFVFDEQAQSVPYSNTSPGFVYTFPVGPNSFSAIRPPITRTYNLKKYLVHAIAFVYRPGLGEAAEAISALDPLEVRFLLKTWPGERTIYYLVSAPRGYPGLQARINSVKQAIKKVGRIDYEAATEDERAGYERKVMAELQKLLAVTSQPEPQPDKPGLLEGGYY